MLLGEAAMWNGQMDMVHPYRAGVPRRSPAGQHVAGGLCRHLDRPQPEEQPPWPVANGWMSRAKRLLDLEEEAAEHGYWALQQSLVELGQHNFAASLALAKQAEELGRRFGDRSLEIRRRCSGRGTSSSSRARWPRASCSWTRRARQLAGELDPFSTLVVYRNTIGACRDVADFESAGEWADAQVDFCDTNTMNAFPGMCRVNHAEVMKFMGRLTEAHELADRAGEELRVWNPRIAGAAFYELARFGLRPASGLQAEQAFQLRRVRPTPEPGLTSVSHRGTPRSAFASIRRAASDDSLTFPPRPLASGRGRDRGRGRKDGAGGRLRGAPAAIGEAYDTSALTASAALARGQVALARGEVDAAFHELHHARTTWDSTGATYDVARAREQLGRALRAGGRRGCGRLGAAGGGCALRASRRRPRRRASCRGAHARNVHRGDEDLPLHGHRRLDRAGKRRRVGPPLGQPPPPPRRDLRAIFADFNGQVVDHTGDGFFAAFEEAPEAIGAAIAIQRAVDQEFEFDIRIGVHTDGALQTTRTTTARACTLPRASAQPRKAGRSSPARRRSPACRSLRSRARAR